MKQRLITGVIAGALFIGLCLLGGWWYHLLLIGMALIGYYEFVKMTGGSPAGGTALWGYLGIIAFMAPWGLMDSRAPLTWEQLVWFVLFGFLLITVLTKNKTDIRQSALLFTAVVYIGSGFYYMAFTRSAPDGHGLLWTFLLLFCIWGSDAGAYFVGKAVGKHKLWPAISPNKTVEGAAGGIVISMIIAAGFAVFGPDSLSIGRALAIGLSCAVVGQLGDLVQSAYKRAYGIKDSGSLLPGHGGILDRCDSWIVVFPFVHMILLMPY